MKSSTPLEGQHGGGGSIAASPFGNLFHAGEHVGLKDLHGHNVPAFSVPTYLHNVIFSAQNRDVRHEHGFGNVTLHTSSSATAESGGSTAEKATLFRNETITLVANRPVVLSIADAVA